METSYSSEIFEETVVLENNSKNYVSLTHNSINISDLFDQVKSPSAGAVSTFFGTTRDNFEGKEVTHLEYEAYPEMALKSMLDICNTARSRWNLVHIAFQHKLGPCPVMEVSIAIVISSAHRGDSLHAVDFAINELKKLVPIWKKEFYGAGEGDATWKSNIEDSKRHQPAAVVGAVSGEVEPTVVAEELK